MLTLLKWTVEDYHRLIENGVLDHKKVELLDGNVVTMPPESPLHTYVIHTGTDYLRETLKGLAQVRDSHPITLSQSEPEPDIAIVKPLGSEYKLRHPQSSDIFWIIEISSSTLIYDLNDKKQVYAEAGIPEYWVVDLNERRVFIFWEPNQNDYRNQELLAASIITPRAFPQLKLSVTELFHW